jgi:hypothetical protein
MVKFMLKVLLVFFSVREMYDRELHLLHLT